MAMNPRQQEIPIQPVERPILCKPYEEPDQHWKYDTLTGAARKEPGRRPASYWYKTERTGSAQMSLLAQEQQDDLPLPNLLRDDVRRWRDADYRGATLATRELLRHWARDDRERRLFFGQREAVSGVRRRARCCRSWASGRNGSSAFKRRSPVRTARRRASSSSATTPTSPRSSTAASAASR